MGHINDLDIINCYIDFSDNGNNVIFNRNEIHKLFANEVISCLEKYKLKHNIKMLGEKGAGELESFKELLLLAWKNRDIISAVLITVKALWNLPAEVKAYLHNIYNKQKPRIIIDLGLETRQEYDYSKSGKYLGLRLINLKYICDEICKNITDKFPVFVVDQSFSLSIQSCCFSASYFLKSERQNSFNSFRLIQLFKNLKVQTNLHTSYSFIKYWLISRTDEMLKIQGDSKIKSPYKYYYFLLSTKVLLD